MADPKEIKRLIEYDDLYYNTGEIGVLDHEYDELKEKMKAKYPDHPYFKTVGSTPEDNEIKLPVVLGSLEKTNLEKVFDWQKGKGYIVASEKVDGVSVLCEWTNGKLTFASTRGDGYTGQNIFDKVNLLYPIVEEEGKVSLRGDATFFNDDYLIPVYKGKKYKNRRNGTAGILNRKDYKEDDMKLLKILFYEVVSTERDIDEEYERFIYIRRLGLKTPEFQLINSAENITPILVNMLTKSKESSPYDVDGIVLAKNLSKRENVLLPENKIAFKMNIEGVEVNVVGVEWNTSRTGRVKPVILLEPTNIGGVTISRVTGFNASFIEDKIIGKGAKISLIRSGDVIPHITNVIKASDNMKLPKRCGVCNSLLKWHGEDLSCTGNFCKGVTGKILAHFFKKLGVVGFSEANLNKFGVTSVEDFLNIENQQRMYISYTQKRKFRAQFPKILNTTPAKLLEAFGIPGIGKTQARDLTSRFVFDHLFKITEDEVGLGPKTNKVFVDNINNYRKTYDYMKSRGMKFIQEEKSQVLSGKKFVITGSLPYRRDEITSKIEDLGGSVTGSVTTKVDYLITNSPWVKSTKMRKAELWSIPIISYSDFLQLCNKN